ncbi:MAG: PAS domain S-box protein [bacterium]
MNRKILLVEDEALIAMYQSRELQKHGFDVSVAYSGEKAVEAVRSDPDIALVLMDIDLGAGIDGTEAAQSILHTHNLPIVFLTSHSEKEIVEKVKGISRYGYVLKNSGVFVLVESINMAFELFEAHQATRSRELRQQQQMEELEAIYHNSPALMVLVNSKLEVRKANTAATEFADVSADALNGSRIGEALRCLNHLNHPQGCGYGSACRQCSVRTTVLSTLKTQRSHLRVRASIPVPHSEREASFLLSSVYLTLREEPTVLVTIEEKKRTNTRNYRSLFNSIRDAILVADTQRRIIDCNPAFTDLFGYQLEEIQGEPTYAVYSSMDEFERMGQAIKKHVGSLSDFLYTIHYQKRDGSVFPGETNVFYLHNDDGVVTGFIGLIRDVTERLRMESELREQEESLRITLNSIGDAVFSTDLEGQVVRMNPVAEQLTGWDLSSARGSPIEEVFHIVDARSGNRIDNPVTEVLETKQIIGLSNHTKLISKTGQEYHIADSAAPITTEAGDIEGAVLVFRDVTEEYLQAQRLRESEEKYRNLVDNAPIGIFQTNSKGQALHANSAMARMVGAETAADALSRFQNLTEQLYVNPQRRTELLALLKEHKHVENFEYQARTLQNETRWFSMNARVSAELSDGTLIIDGFAFDVSEQKQAREKLSAAIAEMNHRVKNNLALVASLISLKESALEESIDLSDVVNQIHAIKLVHERLYCSDDATHTELNAYLSEILHSVFSAWAHREVRIVTDIDKITVPCSTAVTLGLITNEIATNALKYGFVPKDGAHSFTATLHEVPAGSRSFLYTLSNSGPPFPPQIDPATADTLGMQLVTILVNQLQGTLELQKAPQPVFTIKF